MHRLGILFTLYVAYAGASYGKNESEQSGAYTRRHQVLLPFQIQHQTCSLTTKNVLTSFSEPPSYRPTSQANRDMTIRTDFQPLRSATSCYAARTANSMLPYTAAFPLNHTLLSGSAHKATASSSQTSYHNTMTYSPIIDNKANDLVDESLAALVILLAIPIVVLFI